MNVIPGIRLNGFAEFQIRSQPHINLYTYAVRAGFDEYTYSFMRRFSVRKKDLHTVRSLTAARVRRLPFGYRWGVFYFHFYLTCGPQNIRCGFFFFFIVNTHVVGRRYYARRPDTQRKQP